MLQSLQTLPLLISLHFLYMYVTNVCEVSLFVYLVMFLKEGTFDTEVSQSVSQSVNLRAL